MRLLMKNYRYNCRKLIIEGKYRTYSTLSPKEWEALKETVCSKEYLKKRNRGIDVGASPTKHKRGRQLDALAHILKHF